MNNTLHEKSNYKWSKWAAFVVIGTFVSFVFALILPGPITGLMPPIFLTLWWVTYNILIAKEKKNDTSNYK